MLIAEASKIPNTDPIEWLNARSPPGELPPNSFASNAIAQSVAKIPNTI